MSDIIDAIRTGKKPENGIDQEALERIRKKRAPAPDGRITERNIDVYEKETVEAASRAIFVLENALSKWDALKDKPDELSEEFEKFRSFHDRLVEWAEKMLRSRAKGGKLDFNARVDRLLEYSRICKAHR